MNKNSKKILRNTLTIYALFSINLGTSYASTAVRIESEPIAQFEVTGESRSYAYPDFDFIDVEAAADLLAKAHQKCSDAYEIGPMTTEWLTVSLHYFTRMKSIFICQ